MRLISVWGEAANYLSHGRLVKQGADVSFLKEEMTYVVTLRDGEVLEFPVRWDLCGLFVHTSDVYAVNATV